MTIFEVSGKIWFYWPIKSLYAQQWYLSSRALDKLHRDVNCFYPPIFIVSRHRISLPSVLFVAYSMTKFPLGMQYKLTWLFCTWCYVLKVHASFPHRWISWHGIKQYFMFVHWFLEFLRSRITVPIHWLVGLS